MQASIETESRQIVSMLRPLHKISVTYKKYLPYDKAIPKISKDEMQQLEKLYKEATSGVYNTMTQEKGTSPNFDSAMNSFRSQMGREAAQGATQDNILKQQLNQTFQKNPGSSQSSQNKADFIKTPKSPQEAGIKQTRATQSLAKGQTVKFEEPKPKINEETMKSKAQMGSQQGYGNRTGFQQIPGSQPPGSNPYKQRQRGINKSKSKEQIENEYVNLAKSILQKHNAQKYIKDF